MQVRYAVIWFRHLVTDWFIRRRPALRPEAFVLTTASHGRQVVTAASEQAEGQGVSVGMVLADARAIVPLLQRFDDPAGVRERLLQGLGAWCMQYTPVVGVGLPDGLCLDITGCAHLWGGERAYLDHMMGRLQQLGYDVAVGVADTIGTAWAVAHYGGTGQIVAPGEQRAVLSGLPAAALRLEAGIAERLLKLGLMRIGHIIDMQRSALRRRFGEELLVRLDQAVGLEREVIVPIEPAVPFVERLPCLEPIVTRTGIEIALERLLELLCERLRREGKGIRAAVFKGYRVDGKIVAVDIGTSRPSRQVKHLYKLFALKLSLIAPALGIELFLLEATHVAALSPEQEVLWSTRQGLADERLARLLERLAGKMGPGVVHRYLPAEHHWPERSVRVAEGLEEQPAIAWRTDRPRPVRLLATPEPIVVAAPIPDYPPMHFRYKERVHVVKKADGPERIEREWWLDGGQHRDYYTVEDEEGQRYWIFRLGHYDAERTYGWFIHGFFA
ncbi:DNA polymerase Y family protein [Chitinophaga pendula]|uniref:Y-family DNA polymerase n=1 Tax=Chitinophaga TaxID=79328 RepID=UPI000BB09FB0|nr:MULTISPECIES: DNA polymerase Y family protein [Chitinophaga]ASZ13012.1 nucleotidyltransferase [Chitinophaga sp. MD30]UCJ09357.1 DNA polymerase Y family protein [Chitinophaga pendula]